MPRLVSNSDTNSHIRSMPCASGEEPLNRDLSEAGWPHRRQMRKFTASEAGENKVALAGKHAPRHPRQPGASGQVLGAFTRGKTMDGERRICSRRVATSTRVNIVRARPPSAGARASSFISLQQVAHLVGNGCRRPATSTSGRRSRCEAESGLGIASVRYSRPSVNPSHHQKRVSGNPAWWDDSAYVRKIISECRARPLLRGCMGTAREWARARAELKPDVITCRVDIAEMDGMHSARHTNRTSSGG